MRYVTKAERKRQLELERERIERRRWMTLIEAIKYFREKEQCDDYDAVEDLFRAIADRNVKALSGDVPYQEDSLSGYEQVLPNDLQGELKICLDDPGFVKFEPRFTKTINQRTKTIEYPKITIVAGPIVKIDLDNTDLYNPRPIPEVNDYDYWPLLSLSG